LQQKLFGEGLIIEYPVCGKQLEVPELGNYYHCGFHSLFNLFLLVTHKDPADYNIHFAMQEFRILVTFLFLNQIENDMPEQFQKFLDANPLILQKK